MTHGNVFTQSKYFRLRHLGSGLPIERLLVERGFNWQPGFSPTFALSGVLRSKGVRFTSPSTL